MFLWCSTRGAPWKTLIRACLIGSIAVPAASAQVGNRFGVQDRANAAEHVVVIAVQQAISALPPTSAQSVSFVYDAATDSYVRSKQLGPTVLRSPRIIPPGQFSMRLSTSYFRLDERLGPIDYRVDGFVAGGQRTRFGLTTEATVGVVDLAATYGLTKYLELSINLPLVVTYANAKEIFIDDATEPGLAPYGARFDQPNAIDEGIADGTLQVARADMNRLGADFQHGVQTGLGRASIVVKAAAPANKWIRLALASELLLPSPNENELAGSDSTACSARLLAEYPLPRRVSAFLDAGYEHDFNDDTLSRFMWSTGASIAPTEWLTADVGVGGSEYDQAVKWTPDQVVITRGDGLSATMHAVGDNSLTTTLVDLLIGAKVRIATNAMITGAVTTPLINNDGFRPKATGTWAVEVYF